MSELSQSGAEYGGSQQDECVSGEVGRSPVFVVISSTDGNLMSALIRWLSEKSVERNSTFVRVRDMDPLEEVDLLQAQLEGLKTRLRDAERGGDKHGG